MTPQHAPKAPDEANRPAVNDAELQGQLFGSADIGSVALGGPTIVPSKEGGPGGFPITALDVAANTAGDLAIPPEVAGRISSLDLRATAIQRLKEKASYDTGVKDTNAKQRSLSSEARGLRLELQADKEKHEAISVQQRDNADSIKNLKRGSRRLMTEAKLAFAMSEGYEVEIVEIPEDETRYADTQVVPIEQDEQKQLQLQEEIDRRFNDFKRQFAGIGRTKNSTRVKELRRIESEKASLLHRAVLNPTGSDTRSNITDLTNAVIGQMPQASKRDQK